VLEGAGGRDGKRRAKLGHSGEPDLAPMVGPGALFSESVPVGIGSPHSSAAVPHGGYIVASRGPDLRPLIWNAVLPRKALLSPSAVSSRCGARSRWSVARPSERSPAPWTPSGLRMAPESGFPLPTSRMVQIRVPRHDSSLLPELSGEVV
jgi:hypothetical protein